MKMKNSMLNIITYIGEKPAPNNHAGNKARFDDTKGGQR